MRAAQLIAVATAIPLPLLLTYSGVTAWLGAHPRWSFSVTLTGIALGLLSALNVVATRFSRRFALATSRVSLLTAGFFAHFGKAKFVAGYAENDLAGRCWHFGWIGIMAAPSLLFAGTLWPRTANATN